MRYLSVDVYTSGKYDCTNNGVTFEHPKHLVVPCLEGPLSQEDVDAKYVILDIKVNHVTKVFILKGEKRWTMFGGNFVWASDSRFRRTYGDAPVAVHDRIEG